MMKIMLIISILTYVSNIMNDFILLCYESKAKLVVFTVASHTFIFFPPVKSDI